MKHTEMVGDWEIKNMPIPLQFVAFAEAYLDSAYRLCKILKRSTRKRTYPRGAVVLYLAFHSVELFLKAAILNKSPNEGLHHNVENLLKRYRKLYPGKRYYFEIPFGTEHVGFEPSDELPTSPPQDQVNRYPVNKKKVDWAFGIGFLPESFLSKLEEFQYDFERLKKEIFG